LGDGLLKIANAFSLDPLALRFSFFPFNAKLVFLRNVVSARFCDYGGNYGRGQFSASHEYVIEDHGIPHRRRRMVHQIDRVVREIGGEAPQWN
jgi:hypothetical protein